MGTMWVDPRCLHLLELAGNAPKQVAKATFAAFSYVPPGARTSDSPDSESGESKARAPGGTSRTVLIHLHQRMPDPAGGLQGHARRVRMDNGPHSRT